MPIMGHLIGPLTGGAGGIVEVDQDGLSREPMFNNEVTKVLSHLLQND